MKAGQVQAQFPPCQLKPPVHLRQGWGKSGGGRTVFYSGFPFYYFGVKMPFYEMMIIVCSSWCRVFRFGFNGLIWQNNPLAVLSKSLEFVELKIDPGIWIASEPLICRVESGFPVWGSRPFAPALASRPSPASPTYPLGHRLFLEPPASGPFYLGFFSGPIFMCQNPIQMLPAMWN